MEFIISLAFANILTCIAGVAMSRRDPAGFIAGGVLVSLATTVLAAGLL